MEPRYRIQRVREDGARLIEVGSSNLSAHVPGCPDWDCAQLLRHSGRVWHSVALHVERLATEMVPRSDVPVAEKGGEIEYAQLALAHVVEALESADPVAHVWAWAGGGTANFYLRRMHQETLVHRIDAELAAGITPEIDGDDAADGVDELLRVVMPARGVAPPSGSMHLHRTDGEGEWTMELVDGRVVASLSHVKADVAIRATAADLLLALWQRRPLEGLEIFGDRSIAEEWMDLST